jgi:hypothetical protein
MSIRDFLWPERSKESDLNPETLFRTYEDAVAQISAKKPTADDAKLLAQSWKLFDNEAGRRATIDSRAAAIMPALSLVVTLITGVGFTVLKDNTISLGARSVVFAAFLIALIYLIRTMLLVFLVHGKVYRSTLDPSQIIPPGGLAKEAVSPYDRMIACKLLSYTIRNYRTNNVQSDNLFVAQKAFRNAILTLALGGVVAVILIFGHSLFGSLLEAPTKLLPFATS